MTRRRAPDHPLVELVHEIGDGVRQMLDGRPSSVVDRDLVRRSVRCLRLALEQVEGNLGGDIGPSLVAPAASEPTPPIVQSVEIQRGVGHE